ncbi:iron dicitrate transport regulator FecR [Novosphingobium sp. PC22D]|uniref:SIS domain-containing protein n=1 Tax=Novosphingobium sp. PC22D TaxID=1962403 RepID=UPI000BFAC5E4|nr:SIS domain-containing protein [Novosphingobium sp. PC22D]PEQ14339.1 iron dicitrate transport regulator FecR [Novosphingobium sp. PC22D]
MVSPSTMDASVSRTSQMRREAAEAAERAARQVRDNRDTVRAAVERLRAARPPFAATLARGSSDHAASFAKFLFETRLGLPTLSHAPSTGALYHATSPAFAGVPLVAISQSGRSPDLLSAAEDARSKGAVLVALVNDTASPLAGMADVLIPLGAGPETSVAATKSFVASLVALTQIAAEWSDDDTLRGALDGIEDVLDAAWRQDWSQALAPLTEAPRLFVLGRGPTLPIAGEAALKFKEVAGIHAEAFSSAEVAHGPMTLVGPGDPVLIFAPRDVARTGLSERIADFTGRGAVIIANGLAEDVGGASIVLPGCDAHPVIAPIAQILSFYRLVEALALARGRDPDHPPHLRKVTRTL